jgi:ABC-2 type transport system permease protein
MQAAPFKERAGASGQPELAERIVSARVSLGGQLRDLWRYRQLLMLLIRTQLKVKYKNSALGFLWSMLNPALYLGVYYVVFDVILKSGIPNFPIYLLCGLLVWNLFVAAVGAGTSSVTRSAAIVKKVAFPRVILPLAEVGCGLVHFFLQGAVLILALVAFQYSVGWGMLWLLPLALFVLLLFSSALAVLLSAINVYLRDTEHFVELALLAWFWVTPIIYPLGLVLKRTSFLVDLYKLNPMVWVVTAFQRAIYNRTQSTVVTNGARTVTKILPVDAGSWWYAWHLLAVGVVAGGLFLFALAIFGRIEGNFSEEL